MTGRRLILLRVLSVLGAIVSTWLVAQHIDYEIDAELSEGFCVVRRIFDCAATEASAFSSVFNVPTASFGLIWFLSLAAAAFFSPDPSDDRFRATGSLFSLTGVLVCIFLAGVSFFVVGGLCIGCTVIYGITLAVALLFAGNGPVDYLARAIAGPSAALAGLDRIFSDPPTEATVRAKKVMAALLVASLFAMLAPPVLIHRTQSNRERRLAAEVLSEFIEQPKAKFRPAARPLSYGPSDAPLQIMYFTDFDCPLCKRYAPEFKGMLDELPPGSYRITWKHYPLGACNPVMQGRKQEHANACLLAEMAQALGTMGRFDEVAPDLYSIQGSSAPQAALKALAERHGISLTEWAAHAKDPENLAQVRADIEEGNRMSMMAVPSIFINGRYVKSLNPIHVRPILAHVLAAGAD